MQLGLSPGVSGIGEGGVSPGSALTKIAKNGQFSRVLHCLAPSHRLYCVDCSAGAHPAYLPYSVGGHVTFQVGDKVIYPNHGLGVVQGIETKTILGTTCGFYHLRMVANETTVLVPVNNVEGVGLRRRSQRRVRPARLPPWSGR